VKRDTFIEHYYAPPRGLNNLRTHAKLMWVSAFSLWVFGPVIVTPVLSGLSPHALHSPLMEGVMSLVWAMGHSDDLWGPHHDLDCLSSSSDRGHPWAP
jgi:hypothetical protein